MFARIAVVIAVAALLWAVFAHDSGASGPERRYLVRPGDTLWSIVERTYAGDPREGVWKLQRRNALEDATIVPGQRLVMPG
jgi:LysM repeat protein